MKFQLDTSKFNRKQVGCLGAVSGLLVGIVIGWIGGQEALRHQVRQSLGSVFGNGSMSNNTGEPSKPREQSPESDTQITTEKDALNDTSKYYLTILSNAKIPTTYGGEYGSIMVRCTENNTEVFFSAANYLGSDAQSVKMRWDGGAVQSVPMLGAEGGTALFSQSPKSFISKATKAKKLVVSYSPWRKADETAIYEFTDRDRSDMNKMLAYCKDS